MTARPPAGPPPPSTNNQKRCVQLNLRLLAADSMRVTAYKKLKAQLYVASPVSAGLRASVVQKLSGNATQGISATSHSLGASAVAAALADIYSTSWKRALSSTTSRVDISPDGATALGLTACLFLQPSDVICVQLLDTGGTNLGCALALPEWFLSSDSPCVGAWGSSPASPPAAEPAGAAGQSASGVLSLPLAAPPGQPACSGTLSMGGSLEWAPAGAMKRTSLANTVNRSASSGTVAATADAAASSSEPVARIAVLPHWHTKWCDRKRQVCVASGAVRELNRLGVLVAGVPGVTSEQLVVQWMHTRLEDEGAAGAAADAAPGDSEFHHDDTGLDFVLATPLPPPGKASSKHWPLGAARPPLDALAVFGVPPAPPLLHPAAKVAKAQAVAQETAEGRARPGAARANASTAVQWPTVAATAASGLQGALVGAVRRGYGLPPPESVLHDSASALGLLQAELTETCGDPAVYMLRKQDVGRFFLAVVKLPDGQQLVTQVMGPVEAAPPAAREVWIDGAPEVGQVLTAQTYYAGGDPGACTVEWIVVSEEGDRTTHDAAVVDFAGAAPNAADCPEESGPHGRLFRIGAEHVGSIFKVSVNPVRSDGVEGAPATSKPTKEVAASPQ